MNEARNTLANRGYNLIKEIGSGASSHCYLATSVKYNTEFVIKTIDLSLNSSDNCTLTKSYEREICALGQTIHPNIIHIYDHFIEGKQLFLILEYCPGGSIKNQIQTYGTVNPVKIRKYAKDICSALSYCQKQQISHHDIKPANILIDSYGRAKLADFGLAQVNKESFSDTFGGSLAYMAPEVVKKCPYDPFKADIWSLGVTVYQMATGSLPFDIKNKREFHVSASMGFFELCDKIPIDIKKFIKGCLRVNPLKRKTPEELISIITPAPNSPAIAVRRAARNICANILSPRAHMIAKCKPKKESTIHYSFSAINFN